MSGEVIGCMLHMTRLINCVCQAILTVAYYMHILIQLCIFVFQSKQPINSGLAHMLQTRAQTLAHLLSNVFQMFLCARVADLYVESRTIPKSYPWDDLKAVRRA